MDSDLIYDVGAHRGEDTEFYLKKGFRVVGVEANPALIGGLKERFHAAERTGRLRILNIAVAPRSGPVTFYANDSVTTWGTTSPEWVSRNQRRRDVKSTLVTVPGRTFESVLREHGVPYYLKVDIEGADLLCVEALREVHPKPKYVSFESTLTSWSDLLQEFSLLRELGYRWFKVVNQLDVPSQRPPAKAAEGIYTDHVFPYDSSGLFGDEVPGEWLSEKQAIRRYRRIFAEYWLFGNEGILSTLDWKRPLIRRFESLLPPRKWHDTHARR